MDKRKTQRILGILVIIALIIILFPLIFSKNEMATQNVTISTPAFPDQKATTTPVATAETAPQNTPPRTTTSLADPLPPTGNTTGTEINQDMQPTMDTPSPTSENNDFAPTAPADANSVPAAPVDAAAPSSSAPQADDDIAGQVKNNIESNIQPILSPEGGQTISNPPASEPSIIKKQPVKSSKNTIHRNKKSAHHDLANLSKQAWIVQMGSFKSKENARSLTDKLRAAGFNAFTKEIKSARGSARIHVYVGPEFKEASATKISKKIQRELNLPSIVLPYKPLAL